MDLKNPKMDGVPGVRNFRTTYATEKLPRDVNAKVIAEIDRFLAVMDDLKVTTHEAVRYMTYSIESSRVMLMGDLTAQDFFLNANFPYCNVCSNADKAKFDKELRCTVCGSDNVICNPKVHASLFGGQHE